MPTLFRAGGGDESIARRRPRLIAPLVASGLLAAGGAAAFPALAEATTTQQVSVVTIPGVGKVLAVGNHVLYVHTGDTKRHSTCTGACAVAWPPFLVSSKAARHLGHVHGLATFHRSKGHLQVTIDGHPLYFFVGDTTRTSAKGQGFANVFFTVRPNGTAVHVASVAPAPGAPTSTSTTSTTQTTHMQGTPPPAGPAPTSPPPTSPPPTSPPTTSPPTTTTTSPPTTTTTAPSGGGVSF